MTKKMGVDGKEKTVKFAKAKASLRGSHYEPLGCLDSLKTY